MNTTAHIEDSRRYTGAYRVDITLFGEHRQEYSIFLNEFWQEPVPQHSVGNLLPSLLPPDRMRLLADIRCSLAERQPSETGLIKPHERREEVEWDDLTFHPLSAYSTTKGQLQIVDTDSSKLGDSWDRLRIPYVFTYASVSQIVRGIAVYTYVTRRNGKRARLHNDTQAMSGRTFPPALPRIENVLESIGAVA